MLKTYLEKEGYQVLGAYDGTVALKLQKENDISLILLDLMLPDIMGEQICQISRVPIIMLTARAEEADMIKGLQMGADDYIY